MIFYLGTHQTNWLGKTDVPLFISARRLRKRKRLPRAIGRWALDSGAFTELQRYGRWTISAMQYVSEVSLWRDAIGRLDWASPMDWMCEPIVIHGGTSHGQRFAGTHLSVGEHQRQTVANYLLLKQLSPHLPWIPVIQGYTLSDYRNCILRYIDAGVPLTDLPLVGIGSVCRRQASSEIQEIIEFVRGWGIAAHAFGVKIEGINRYARHLASADSMAWSREARWEKSTPPCVHPKCNNCLLYALRWYGRILDAIDDHQSKPLQSKLFATHAE